MLPTAGTVVAAMDAGTSMRDAEIVLACREAERQPPDWIRCLARARSIRSKASCFVSRTFGSFPAAIVARSAKGSAAWFRLVIIPRVTDVDTAVPELT